MILGRKFKIWFIAFGLILVVFLFFLLTTDTGSVRVVNSEVGITAADANIAVDSNTGTGQIGDARLGYLSQARFETIDQKTRQLKRVIGFDKVLHKSGDNWELDKPFMTIFQKDLRCDLTADTGLVELENVRGSQPSPRNATLKGNVVIHIMPEGKSSPEDSFIYLDEIKFDGDRSRFTSDSKIIIESKVAHLEGRGLEIVYNGLSKRLEYLEIKKLDFLDIRQMPGKSSAVPAVPPASGRGGQTAAQPPQAKASPVSSSSVPVSSSSVPVKPASDANSQDNYQCVFNDNVRIIYDSNEVILADRISINNLLWQSGGNKPSSPAQQAQTSESNSVPAEYADVNSRPTAPPEPGNAPPSRVIAVVKCSGMLVVKPESMKLSDSASHNNKFRSYSSLDEKTKNWLGTRSVLLAQRIDYDYIGNIARALGRVELVSHTNSGRSSAQGRLPVVISAKNGAEFIVAQKRALFYGDVVGSLTQDSKWYIDKNNFYGDRLIVDIAESGGNNNLFASGGIKHIEISGPAVRLESVRTAGEEKISHVRLTSKRIDYCAATGEITASGKGRIEYNKIALPRRLRERDGKNKPCYALIDGFNKLLWNTRKMHIMVQGEGSGSLHIGYLPIEADGSYGEKVTVDTRRIDIDYIEPQNGKAELIRLLARGGVVYYEQDKYEFVGERLLYNAPEGLMTVTGSKNTSCMLNGAFVDGIEYNLKTGRAQSVISGGVGVISVGR